MTGKGREQAVLEAGLERPRMGVLFEGGQQGLGVSNGWQAGAPAADQGPDLGALGARDIEQHLGQGGGYAAGQQAERGDAHNGLVDAKPGDGCGFEAVCLGAGADDDDLDGIEEQALESQAITAGIEAEVLHDAGEGAQGVFGDLAIFGAAGESFEPEEGGGGGGIAGRRGRVLQRLAARAERAQRRVPLRVRRVS